jgi:diadenosine tetraphosphate (Ap4A) HIT family hydrolase
VPESAEEFWARTHDALRMPPVEEWDTWPFAGSLQPRELAPPADAELPRHGAGGVGCRRCERGLEGALWSNDHWVVSPLAEPSGLPAVVILETREHVDFPDLSDELAAELGPLLLKVQRAVLAIGEIGNVHVCRWGDGSEHCHVWFMARPARVPQLNGSFAAIWDDVLPPLPDEVWRANLEVVRSELAKPS